MNSAWHGQQWELNRKMPKIAGTLGVALIVFAALISSLSAQLIVTPKAATGGEVQGGPWAGVPESFRKMKIPEWPVPTDRTRWEEQERSQVRKTLLDCLGEMPSRPDPRRVRVTSREEKPDYVL